MKRGWTVWNEAIEETFLERNEGESPNDRNDRGALPAPLPSSSRFLQQAC